ncbi:MAG: energy transducer TonB [Acidobacteriota bacterium]|nr:MAG: energy transducer TonB [Acidobacteriota bacterium]
MIISWPNLLKILWISLLLQSSLGVSRAAAVDSPRQFLYLSDHRIITLELVDDSSVILNYINLDTTFDLLRARDVVLVDDSGKGYRGHLFQVEEEVGSENPYKVSYLIKPGEFSGFVIVSNFELKAPLQTAYLKIAGRIIQLEAVSAENFEVVASRIGELNLSADDTVEAIRRAGFRRGFGDLVFSGAADAGDVEGYFKDESVVAPVPLKAPKPRLPSSESRLPDPVFVRISAYVGTSGGLRNLAVVEGLNEKLDKIAIETVRNSWVFLPAIADGKLAGAELKLNIVFQR